MGPYFEKTDSMTRRRSIRKIGLSWNILTAKNKNVFELLCDPIVYSIIGIIPIPFQRSGIC